MGQAGIFLTDQKKAEYFAYSPSIVSTRFCSTLPQTLALQSTSLRNSAKASQEWFNYLHKLPVIYSTKDSSEEFC